MRRGRERSYIRGLPMNVIAGVAVAGTVTALAHVPTLRAAERAGGTPKPVSYAAVDLGLPAGGRSCRAFALNNRGQVVGEWRKDDPARAGRTLARGFLYERGRMRDLGAFSARDINDRGQIIGQALAPRRDAPTKQSFAAHLWEGGRLRRLGGFPEDTFSSEPFALNDRGQVLGLVQLSNPYIAREFLWEEDRMRGLGRAALIAQASGNGTEEEVNWNPARARGALNDRGQIAGSLLTPVRDRYGIPIRHACLYHAGRVRDVGVLPRFDRSEAVAVNAAGQVAGTSRRTVAPGEPPGESRAFLRDGGGMSDLGVLPGGRFSSTAALNDRGQVVGSSHVAVKASKAGARSYRVHLFLWEKGRMRDLTVAAALSAGEDIALTEAVAINDRGEVLCNGWRNAGKPTRQRRVFLLVPRR